MLLSETKCQCLYDKLLYPSHTLEPQGTCLLWVTINLWLKTWLTPVKAW